MVSLNLGIFLQTEENYNSIGPYYRSNLLRVIMGITRTEHLVYLY